LATVLVALAATESSPSQISAGKESSVPPPATELMAPARKAAKKATPACARSIGGTSRIAQVTQPDFSGGREPDRTGPGARLLRPRRHNPIHSGVRNRL